MGTRRTAEMQGRRMKRGAVDATGAPGREGVRTEYNGASATSGNAAFAGMTHGHPATLEFVGEV